MHAGRDLVRLVAATTVFLGVFRGHAEPLEREPLRVELRAPRDCGEVGSFLDQVLRRTRRARRAEPNEPARAFSVEILEQAGRFEGTLRVVTATREVVERKVDAKTCGEVVEALALVAALIVDPEALTTPLAPPVAATPAPPPAPATPAPPPLLQVPPERSPPPNFGVGLGIELAYGIVPEIIPVERAWTELAWRGPGVFRPSLGLGFGFASAGFSHNSLHADILWMTARLSACPLELIGSRRVSLRPCALFEVGAIRGRGSRQENVNAREATTKPWAAPGVGVGFAWVPFSPLVLRVEAGGMVEAIRTTFAYRAGGTDQLVYQVPPFGAYLGLGAGVVF